MGVLLVTGILKEITCLQAVADDEACKYGYESWIAYCYKTNIFTRFITICPCCKKSFTNDNPAVGGHVLAEYGRLNTEGRFGYTKCVTPICKKCNDRFKWRKRSIPTHLERHNPPTIIAKMGLKRA